MIIKKVFNNNVILAKDFSNEEIVVMGCGIAFKKKVGDKVEENLIEKTFILKQKEASEKLKILLEDIPAKDISLCYDIIEYAKNILNVKFNDYIYVTLTDHISNALKMHDEGLNISNSLLWEIRKAYPKEYKVGLKALDLIKEETEKSLPEDEAGNIALHLINAQVNNTYKIDNINNVTKKIKDILNIIKYTYNIQLDENSINYERFVTHLKFFFERLNKNETVKSKDDFLLQQVKRKYEKAYKCMLKIEEYLNVNLSNDEQLYLSLHIQRVTKG